MTTQRDRGLEMVDVPGPSVEPGAARDDPNPETPGERLERTSKSYYGKTIKKEDAEEAVRNVRRRQAESEARRERAEQGRGPWSLKGGEDEPGG